MLQGILRAIIFAMILFAGIFCVLAPGSEVIPLRLERAGAKSDTLPPFPTLRITFGEPLQDSLVELAFTPPFPCAFSARLNARHDTLTVRVTGMLEGETRYVVRLAAPVSGVNGGRLHPHDDSLVFYTYARESGQNRTALTADTLSKRLFGLLELAGDTAFFIAGGSMRKFYAAAYDAPCRIAVRDSWGAETISDPIISGKRDTVAAPGARQGPFTVRIYADPLQAGVRFEAGGVEAL